MKIALIGYGKMGQLLEQIAQAKGNQVVARFSRQHGLLRDRVAELAQAEIVIDFSEASGVIEHLELCLELGKPLVIGTTGWEKDYAKAQEWVKQRNGSCFYAPNFSIGLYLFQHIIAYAASLFSAFEEYDVSGIEYHHRQKRDAPSGTAKLLSQIVSEQMPGQQDFHFSSVRCGHMPGTHTLHFDSPIDTLTFTHQARNRNGFAEGALLAAQWLLPRKGFFTMQEMMNDLDISSWN